MTTIHFVFRQSSLDKSLQGGISVRITNNRQSRTIALPFRVYANEWNYQKECSTNVPLNKELQNIRNHIEQIVDSFTENEFYSVDDISFRFRCQLNGRSLIGFTNEVVKSYIKNGQTRTVRAYLSAVNKFIAYYGDNHVKLTVIDSLLMEDFERSLLKENLSRNTISFYMRNLRSLYNKAVQMHEVKPKKESPFAKVFTGIEKTKKRALSKDDLNKINNLNLFNNKKLQEARNLFLFGFHACGMSFIDMAYLKKKDIRNGVISYRRKKTGRMVEVSITKNLQRLINYFMKKSQGSIYLLPILTEDNKDTRLQYENRLRLQNKQLNLIARLCQLAHALTTHVCRHTWASIARNIHTPLALISESLGHSDEKTTSIYLASFDRSVIHKVSEQVSSIIDRPIFNYVYQ